MSMSRRWYESSADLGNTEACVGLALLLEQIGEHEAAVMWRAKATAREIVSHLEMSQRLARADMQDEASSWLAKAADLGSIGACMELGYLAEHAGDTAAAKGWYERAANAGSVEASAALAWLTAG